MGAVSQQREPVPLMFLSSGEIFYLFNCRSLRHSMFRIGLFSNRWALGGVTLMVLLQLLFTYLPAMHTAFGSQSIGVREWRLIIGASLIVYIVIELEKWLRSLKAI